MEMKKHAEEHENDERWLLTYADLITLLMVFFVVMYAMSNTDAQKFKALAAALSGVFGDPATHGSPGQGGQVVPGNAIMPNRSGGDSRKGTRHQKSDGDTRTRRMQALKSDLDSLMEQRGLSKSVSTKVDPRGPKLIMELSDSLLFDVGSADLTAQAIELMKPVAEVLAARQYNIHVEGHTDNLPISDGRYRNNFELSTARAVNVIENLITAGGLPPQLFSASGYGEYRPVSTNDTAEGRAKNRRVDFVVYDENALEAMLGDMPSDEAGEGAASLDDMLSQPAATEPTAVTNAETAPTSESVQTPAHGAAPATEPTHAEPHAAPASTHSDPHAAPAVSTTTTPKLDAHVSQHVVDDDTQTLSSIMALPRTSAR